jgi:hypothetical protein
MRQGARRTRLAPKSTSGDAARRVQVQPGKIFGGGNLVPTLYPWAYHNGALYPAPCGDNSATAPMEKRAVYCLVHTVSVAE